MESLMLELRGLERHQKEQTECPANIHEDIVGALMHQVQEINKSLKEQENELSQMQSASSPSGRSRLHMTRPSPVQQGNDDFFAS
jgi:hypothetical protein